MLRLITKLVFAVLAAVSTHSVSAFTPLGAFAPWMDDVKGYTGFTIKGNGNIGGPMNLGEEYRWNVPILTYGFDESFLNYFGEEGIKAVEKAIKMINDLPPMSQMSNELLDTYPLNTMRRNYRASALTLLDMKSYALHFMIEELGLAQAEEWVYTVREEWHDNANPYNPYFIVIKRNFDPVTWNPSSYVNGTLYSYQIYHSDSPSPHYGLTQMYSPDPLAFTFTSVSGGYLGQGMYYSGLTKDDIGGLRYLYRPDNFNVEGVVQGTSYSTNQTLASGSGTGWTVVGTTNIIPGAVPSESPWYPINYTNIVFATTNTTTTNATVADATGTNTLVALRPGVDKIRLFRVIYDSYLGQLSNPITNRYIDNIISNNVVRHQVLERVVSRPDIVFAARDLGAQGGDHYPDVASRTAGFVNNDGINGDVQLDGPGIIQFPINIIFNKVGPWIENGPGYMTETTGFQYFTWGHFDGSTNDPIVFPQGTSIRDLERQVLGY